VGACITCGADPCTNPGFCASCREADKRRIRGEQPRYIDTWDNAGRLPSGWERMSISTLWSALNYGVWRPTPQSTIDAIVHSVRERGPAALLEPVNIARLRACDAAARAEIDQRIIKLRGPK